MLDDYENYLLKVVGLNKETCNRYRRSVERFQDYCDAKDIVAMHTEPKTIKRFIGQYDGQTSLQILLLAGLRRYYQFLIYNDVIKHNPTKNIKSATRKRVERTQFSVDDIAALLRANTSTPVGIRNQAIITLLYATGMRCTEITLIKMLDVDLENKLLRVFGKNAKERLIPINDIAVDCLRHYLKLRPMLFYQGRSSPYAFITEVQNHQPLHRNTIWKAVKQAAKKAGLGEAFTTHNLRHCFATHMLQNGANLRVIQELLGHAQISTTQVYTQLDKDALKALHNTYHPRSK